MRTIFAKRTGLEFDAMVDRGAFDCIERKKVELIRGELRFMNPTGPQAFKSFGSPISPPHAFMSSQKAMANRTGKSRLPSPHNFFLPLVYPWLS